MATITKKELVDKIAETQQVRTVTAQKIVQAFLDEIVTELSKGNRLEFRDFGIFDVKTRAAREAQTPKTLERVHVSAKRSVKFKMGRMMRQKLNTSDEYENTQKTQ